MSKQPSTSRQQRRKADKQLKRVFSSMGQEQQAGQVLLLLNQNIMKFVEKQGIKKSAAFIGVWEYAVQYAFDFQGKEATTRFLRDTADAIERGEIN